LHLHLCACKPVCFFATNAVVSKLKSGPSSSDADAADAGGAKTNGSNIRNETGAINKANGDTCICELDCDELLAVSAPDSTFEPSSCAEVGSQNIFWL